jgi:hypothetical protein
VSHLRASFALRAVIVLADLVAIGTMIWLYSGHAIATLVIIVVVAVVEIELELVAGLIERWIVRRAERRGHQGSTFWFVDLDEERRARAAAFVEDTRNNPTLR